MMEEQISKYNICSVERIETNPLKNPFITNIDHKLKKKWQGTENRGNFKKFKIKDVNLSKNHKAKVPNSFHKDLMVKNKVSNNFSKKKLLQKILQDDNHVKTIEFRNGHIKQKQKKKVDQSNLSRESIITQKKNLPIYSARNQILKQLKKFEISILIGETGSGKTTQIPQFLYEDQQNEEGAICITQPRRVAAITIAQRVAKEMNCTVGSIVGYSVRFEDCYSQETKVKYVTDGMLLREALSDHLLLRYKWIILDEAHERSINTDILFGVVKEAQKWRRLKGKLPLYIIVMSATMDVDHFSTYFNHAPVLYVEGRQHSVEVYSSKKHHSDYTLACLSTMLKIHKEAPSEEDILMFLTGQEEIDYAVKLISHVARDRALSSYPNLKVYPLYSALPNHKQLKVFSPSLPGERKVIVSTNIAETSVTIPGIKYVIDSGHVKTRTFNSTSGFDDLKVCKISQAQAWQRTGRAGREGPGVCYRVYTDEEFYALSINTVPEILRANLSSVLLKLLAIGIKNILDFDFIDKPKKERLKQAQTDLEDLKVITEVNGTPILTQLGRKMSIFPLEPHYAKLLINSSEYSCSIEILTLIAILSSESVFFTPRERQEEAKEKWLKFTAAEGDHITLINIYNAFKDSNPKKVWCRKNFLNFRNLSYASEVRHQLEELCIKNKVKLISCNGTSEPILKCLISVLYKNIGEVTFGGKYKLLHSAEFAKIHPSSMLFSRSPDYVLFTNLVKTGLTYMHLVSQVKANWLVEWDFNYFRSRHIRKMD